MHPHAEISTDHCREQLCAPGTSGSLCVVNELAEVGVAWIGHSIEGIQDASLYEVDDSKNKVGFVNSQSRQNAYQSYVREEVARKIESCSSFSERPQISYVYGTGTVGEGEDQGAHRTRQAKMYTELLTRM